MTVDMGDVALPSASFPPQDEDVHPVLVTDRLTLRRLVLSDVDNLLILDGDPEVMRFVDRKTRSRAEIQATVLPRFLSYYERYHNFGVWVAETRSESRFVGCFALRPVTRSEAPIVKWPESGDQTSTVEIGYRLRRDAWGSGYATEVTRALVRHAFTDLNVEEIVATTMTVNQASRRVMEKAGLRYARTLFLDWADPLEGSEFGEVEYGLHRDDWNRA